MNEFWKLDNLYKGFDDPCFDADMTALKEKVAEAADLAGRLDTYAPVDGLRRGIELEEHVQCLVMKLVEYAQLRQIIERRNFWCHCCYFEMAFDLKTGGPARVRDVQILFEDMKTAEQWREQLFQKKLDLLEKKHRG